MGSKRYFEPVPAFNAIPSQRSGYETAKRILDSGVPLDSFLVLFDNSFRGVLYRLLEKGVKIPEEIALISHANKGIDISGKAGDPVKAAASGKVVYAGAGIKSYGNLLILRPGQYRFGDFLRVGLPLTVLVALVSAWMARWLWMGGPLLPSFG